MTGDLITPAQLASLMAVSDRTVRRMATAYAAVFTAEPLPANPRNPAHRMFSPVAVERIQLAAAMMRDHPGLSAQEALATLRDGLPLPLRHDQDQQPRATLQELLDEVRDLRADLADMRRLLSLVADSLPTAPAAPAPAADPAPAPVEPPAASQGQTRLPAPAAALIEALERGERLLTRPGGRTGEIAELHDHAGNVTRRIDPRTVAALVRYGLLQRDPDGNAYRLTADPLL